jgi:hypothetical protein
MILLKPNDKSKMLAEMQQLHDTTLSHRSHPNESIELTETNTPKKNNQMNGR